MATETPFDVVPTPFLPSRRASALRAHGVVAFAWLLVVGLLAAVEALA